MLFTLLLMGIFLMIAIIFSLGKGSSLIAGYNTMSEEEKAQYDRVALTKFMGKVMFVLVFSMSFWVLSEWFQVEWLFFVGLGLFLVIVFFAIIYINTGERFKKNKNDMN